jgi:hypothetical protein
MSEMTVLLAAIVGMCFLLVFSVYSGVDALTDSIIAQGVQGVDDDFSAKWIIVD